MIIEFIKRPFTVREGKIILFSHEFLLFILVVFLFLLEGFIYTLNFSLGGILPYKRILIVMATFAATLVLKAKSAKLGKTEVLFFAICMVATLSFLINRGSLIGLINYIVGVFLAYGVYFVGNHLIDRHNYLSLLRACFAIGFLQLPVLIAQRLLYKYMPSGFKEAVTKTDTSFGTFYVYGDPAMSIFLVFLIIFLLWDKQANQVIKRRKIAILWFSISIFFANSGISQAILLLVYGIYFLQTLKKPLFFYLGLASIIPTFAILIAIFVVAPIDFTIPHLFVTVYKSGIRILLSGEVSELQMQKFLSGGYSREAALYYLFVMKDFLVLGEGPGTFYGVFKAMGHFFVFYAETGIIGLTLSYVALFYMGEKLRKSEKKYFWILFMAISLLTLTTDVFRHCAIVFIYLILCRSYLLKYQSQKAMKRV